MSSADPTLTTTLTANLRRLGLADTAGSLDDLIARATRARWSPTVLLDTLVRAELDTRARRRLERQLQAARLGRFKPLADFEWTWPKHVHRPTVDRVFSLDFIAKGENVVLVAAQGLGKTMLTKNLLHQAVLAGHSALFITASDLLLDLNGQDTSRAPWNADCGPTRVRRSWRSMRSAICPTTPTRLTCSFKSSVAGTNNARSSSPPICSSSSGTRSFRTRPVRSP